MRFPGCGPDQIPGVVVMEVGMSSKQSPDLISYKRVILGLYWGYIEVILGLHWGYIIRIESLGKISLRVQVPKYHKTHSDYGRWESTMP